MIDLAKEIDELQLHWRAALQGNKITLADISVLLDGMTMMVCTAHVDEMQRAGKSIDEINQALQTQVMPTLVKLRNDIMARLNAFRSDPTAPSHALQ